MKKLVPIVSASVVTGLALLSFVACSPSASSDNDRKPDTAISASATPSATAPTSTSTPEASSQAVNDSSGSEVRVSPPTELKIYEVTTDSVKVSWVAPTNTVGKIIEYKVLLKENREEITARETTETGYAFTGLKSNNAYTVEVRVVAVSANGVKKDTSLPAVSNTVVVRSSFAAETPVQTSAPVAPSSQPSASTEAEVEKVASALTQFYKFVGSPESFEEVKEAGKDYGPDFTDAEWKKMAADFPEGFKYFDTSSSKSISDSYNQLLARTTQSNRTGGVVTVTVPVDAVTANEGKATIDSTKLKVESKGKTSTGTEAPYFENAQLNLIKQADGSWVLIPETPRHSIP